MPAAKADSLYVIDGIVLGEQAEPGGDYRCEPAKRPAGFTWCERTRQEKSRRRTFDSTLSMLSNEAGDAIYVNRLIEPAFFGSRDIASEIARLSARFGEPARETRLPQREDVPASVIAVWGKLQLQPIDDAARAALDVDGVLAEDLLVDPLGDLKRSRELGLPIYRLAGGAGYLWSASHVRGRGHLRFLMADPSALIARPAVPSATVQPKTFAHVQPTMALAGTAAAAPVPEHTGSIPVNMTVRAKSRPDHAVSMPPHNEIDRAVLESERLAPEYTGSIATPPAGLADEPSTRPAPSLHRIESILALAALAAVLLFFLASLIERLVREPTGLELLELERRRELAAELAEQQGVDALNCIRPEGRFAALRRVAAGFLSTLRFGGGLKSVAVYLPTAVRRT